MQTWRSLMFMLLGLIGSMASPYNRILRGGARRDG